MQSANISSVPEKTEIAEGREADGNVAVNHGNCFKNLEGNVGKTPQNLTIQKTNNPERTVTESHAQTVFKQLDMDKALDTLWEIEYCIQDQAVRKKLGFKTESSLWGTLKNAFCKFLGFFCNVVKEKRTDALNRQIKDVFLKICDDESFYKNVLLPVMNDRDIDEELKTACFNLFKDKEKLSLDLKTYNSVCGDNPSITQEEIEKKFAEGLNKLNADTTYDILRYYKDEIKDGKLFGEDVYARWLSPLMKKQSTTEETKLKFYTLFDKNPDIQDKLFKSLKNPPNEIREKFWERNEEKILNGSLMEKLFGIEKPVTQMSKAQWEACKGNPLTEMLCVELEKNEKLTEEDITKDVVMDSFHTDEDKKRFARVYLKSVSNQKYLQNLFKQQDEKEIHHMVKDTSHKEKAITFFENLFASDNFDENTATKMASNQVFMDLARSVDAKVEFTFAGDRKFTITRQDCFDNSKAPPVKSFTTFCKNLANKQKALNLTSDEKHKLADFLAVSSMQGYVAALKWHFVFEEHNVGANVSFSGEKTKVTVPFKFPVVPFLPHPEYISSFNDALQSAKGEITGLLELEHKDINHIKEVQYTTVKELKLSFEEP